MKQTIYIIFILFSSYGVVSSWDTEQLEVFDVVDQLKGENFYQLLGVEQVASQQVIRSSFKALSLKWHPDKNEEDTTIFFRNLVAVYDILRSPAKRQYYDDVLINGLPNWRSAVYYYRYVRKMGMVEACIILFILITIGQYLVNWAAFFEHKYNLEQKKKPTKKNRPQWNPEYDAVVKLRRPSIFDTLPIQVPRLIWYSIKAVPFLILSLHEKLPEMRKSKVDPIEIVEPAPPKLKKRTKFIPPEGPNFQLTPTAEGPSQVPPPISGGGGGLWTDDDLSELIRLVKKYPGGTVGRWDVIAEQMGRTTAEVTFMANKMKENPYKASADEVPLPPIKIKTRKMDEDNCSSTTSEKKWNQGQQKALEEALSKYPKSDYGSDRWDRIADCVPYKNREECMLRYRYLAEVCRRQKSETNNL